MAKTPFDAIDRFVADLDQTGDPLRIQSLLEREVLRLGFERFTYWLLWSSEGPRVPFWLTNYPPKWAAHYNKSDFKSHDIIATHASVSVRPFLWSDLPRHSLTKAQRAVFDDAIPFGLRAGGNIPLHGPGKARATLTVACNCSDRAFERLFTARRHELRLVAIYTHERIIALGLDRASAYRVKLTPREIDVLAWSAKGKTRRDVGTILGVTEEAVKKHITNACRKLNTSNKMHAAAAAIALGLVIP